MVSLPLGSQLTINFPLAEKHSRKPKRTFWTQRHEALEDDEFLTFSSSRDFQAFSAYPKKDPWDERYIYLHGPGLIFVIFNYSR